MTNKEKLDYIIDQMVVMGETGHMKALPFLNVNNFARNIIEEEGITPGELTDRIKQALLDVGDKDKFNEKTVEVLMANAESLRNISDYTTKQPEETVAVEETDQEPIQEETVNRKMGRGI